MLDTFCFLTSQTTQSSRVPEVQKESRGVKTTSEVKEPPPTTWRTSHEHLVSRLTSSSSNYSRHIRPSEGSAPTSVTMVFRPVNLVFLDEKSQTMNLRIELILNWTDSQLAWNPLDYDDIRRIYFSESAMWLPPIQLVLHGGR